MDGRPPSITRVLKMLAGLSVLSVVTGVLMAGLALPAVYAAGSSVQSGVQFFENMPSEFTMSPPAQQSRIEFADGSLIANPYDENRIVVTLDKISPWMQKAQIAIEDARFYEHGGLDLRAFSRAVASGLTGAQVQGGSTLSMQYVKLSLQQNALRAGDKKAAQAATALSLRRKLQELRYTLHVEQAYTKKQILAGYLNLAYYGDNAYGVEAAAQNYFGIPASKLNLGQSALLAGIVQTPGASDPVRNPKAATVRRNVVLSRMVQLGMAPRAQAEKFRKIPIASMLKRKKLGGVCQRSPEPYICEFVIGYIMKSPQMAPLGKTAEQRMRNINQGGYRIKVTIDPKLQKWSTDQLRRATPKDNMQNLGSASATIEPSTGKIRALAQWSDYRKTQIVFSADRKYRGSGGYQFGSTAKMFVLVTALEKGMSLFENVAAPSEGPGGSHTFLPSDNTDKCGLFEPWEVKNGHGGPQTMSLAQATSASVNTAFAALVLRLGACDVRSTMTRMGLLNGDGTPIPALPSSVAVGSGAVTPLTMAAAYGVLPANGVRCEPTPIESVTDWRGKPVTLPPTSCKKVIEPGVAAGVTKLLQGVMTGGTGAGLWPTSHPVAGKTGTGNGNNQTWFAGYTAQLSTAVWVGNVRPADKNGNEFTLNGKSFGDYGYIGQVFGASIAGRIWAQIMQRAHDGLPNVPFAQPPSTIVAGNYIDLPNVYGRTPADAKMILESAGFQTYNAGKQNSSLPAGLVSGTDPPGRALKGTRVGIYISTGYVPPVVTPTTPTTKPSSGGTTTKGPTTPPGKTKKPR